jgi:hypothetical protein
MARNAEHPVTDKMFVDCLEDHHRGCIAELQKHRWRQRSLNEALPRQREALDGEIREPREGRRQIVAHREFQPAAAFHDRENRRNLRSRRWAANVYPVLPVMYTCT